MVSHASARCVVPERLDDLAPDDALAQHSRRDLRRVHRVMRSLSILEAAVSTLGLKAPPRRILELGAGDGSLLLRLARARRRQWADVHLVLLDRHDLISFKTRDAFSELGWHVSVTCADAIEWARTPAPERYDLCVTTLFLHHFDDRRLSVLLEGIAARAEAFIACEPRRDALSRFGSRLIGLLGANAVTREDAVKSVAAGFTSDELSRLWSQVSGYWYTQEYPAKPFTHCFVAARTGAGHPKAVAHGS
jgi:SAM-dependent methyltransferase